MLVLSFIAFILSIFAQKVEKKKIERKKALNTFCAFGGITFACNIFILVVQGLDFVVDGGVRVADPSTVVDMTKLPPKVLRQGKVVSCLFACSKF